MALDDFVETEVGLAVAATAALYSPRVRGALRRGAVYGLAGVLKAGDAVASAGRGVASGVRGAQAKEEPTPAARTQPAPATAAGAASRPPRTRTTARPAAAAKT